MTENLHTELNVIASDIEKVSKIAEVFSVSRFKQKAVLVLLKHQTGLPERDIKRVLDALPLLSKEYLKPLSGKK